MLNSTIRLQNQIMFNAPDPDEDDDNGGTGGGGEGGQGGTGGGAEKN